MKTLRRLCAAFVLALALSLAASAGTMPAGVVDPPPPPSQATATGEISTGVTGDIHTGVTATDPVTETLLTLLQSLLSLF
jgi:Spy/CpxP family protein refolding chaperone